MVYSRALAEPRSARTRVEREFDPDAVTASAGLLVGLHRA
jgi:hypothetical protein